MVTLFKKLFLLLVRRQKILLPIVIKTKQINTQTETAKYTNREAFNRRS